MQNQGGVPGGYVPPTLRSASMGPIHETSEIFILLSLTEELSSLLAMADL